MKIIAVPMLLLSLVLISHGSDNNNISIMNIIGFILLIISGSYIIVDAKNNKDEESK